MLKCTTIADEGPNTQKSAKTDAILGFVVPQKHLGQMDMLVVLITWYNNAVCGMHFFQL
jgi:hypothetical protein